MQMNKRTKVLAGGIALTVLGSGAAYAYWTAGGSGTGTAATAESTVALTVVQTTTVTPMYPGLAAQTLSGNFNNTNSGPVYVATVTASIASVTKSLTAVLGVCDASDYTLATPAMTVNAQVPAGTAQGAWTGATVAFNNKAGANQDACKGATVNLAYTIS